MTTRFGTTMFIVPLAIAAGTLLADDVRPGVAAMFVLALINAACRKRATTMAR